MVDYLLIVDRNCLRKFRRQKRHKECKVQDSRNLELGDEPGLEIANSGETLDKTVDDPDANKYDIKTPVTLIDLLDNDKEKVGEKVKAREAKEDGTGNIGDESFTPRQNHKTCENFHNCASYLWKF